MLSFIVFHREKIRLYIKFIFSIKRKFSVLVCLLQIIPQANIAIILIKHPNFYRSSLEIRSIPTRHKSQNNRIYVLSVRNLTLNNECVRRWKTEEVQDLDPTEAAAVGNLPCQERESKGRNVLFSGSYYAFFLFCFSHHLDWLSLSLPLSIYHIYDRILFFSFLLLLLLFFFCCCFLLIKCVGEKEQRGLLRGKRRKTRPTLSQLWSSEIRHSTFLNYIQLADLWCCKIVKGSVG